MGGGKTGSSDVGDFFYFFERHFHKNRTQILKEPITYMMLLIEKWNQEKREKLKAAKKANQKGKK